VSSPFVPEDHRKANFSTSPWLTFRVLGYLPHPADSEIRAERTNPSAKGTGSLPNREDRAQISC
jgi:hypothetical protein